MSKSVIYYICCVDEIIPKERDFYVSFYFKSFMGAFGRNIAVAFVGDLWDAALRDRCGNSVWKAVL